MQIRVTFCYGLNGFVHWADAHPKSHSVCSRRFVDERRCDDAGHSGTPERLITEFTGSTARAAYYVGLFATAFALTQFVMSPVLGSLSDRYGRRGIILSSALGQARSSS